MSILSAPARQVRSPQAFRVSRQNLGDSVRGPAVTDVAGNLKMVKQLF